jgi:hypothetical protein
LHPRFNAGWCPWTYPCDRWLSASLVSRWVSSGAAGHSARRSLLGVAPNVLLIPTLTLVLAVSAGQALAALTPFRRGNVSKAVGWAEIRERLGVPDLHLHDLRHAGNTFAAQSGASLRDLMVRMGHDSPAAALIYQHSSRASDEAIAAALDAQLTARPRTVETDSGDGSGAHVGPDEGQPARPEATEGR